MTNENLSPFEDRLRRSAIQAILGLRERLNDAATLPDVQQAMKIHKELESALAHIGNALAYAKPLTH
jgi:hypothetical protein